MINEYFGVGVVSVAKDGVAPELNPGRVHRRINPALKYGIHHYLLSNFRKEHTEYQVRHDRHCNNPNHINDSRVLRGGVVSAAKDGAAPELNPGRVHRRINPTPKYGIHHYLLDYFS